MSSRIVSSHSGVERYGVETQGADERSLTGPLLLVLLTMLVIAAIGVVSI